MSASPIHIRLVLALALAALALAAFWPATGFDFVNLDDPAYVRDNAFVNTGLSAENVRRAFRPHENWWLPLLWISYMADAELSGSGPAGFHRTNVLLHAANVVLLFWFLSRATKSPWTSAFVAALFALHPQRVEAVAWITSRKDVLSGLFFFLALLAYARHAERPSAARMAPVAALMLLGLLSKAILIALPLLLLLLDFWPLRRAGDPLDRREWKSWGRLIAEKGPLFLLVAVFVAVNLSTHVTGRGGFAGLPAGARLALVFPNYWAYVAKFFWPHPLAVVYPVRDAVAPGIAVSALGALVLATLAVLRLRRRMPALPVGWLWFLVALLPVIRGLRLGIASMADRFSYLPSIGLALALAWTLPAVFPSGAWRRPVFATAAALVLAFCAVATRAYLLRWQDSETLFRHALACTRNNYVVALDLAGAYARQNRTAEQIDALRLALDANPACAAAHAELARLMREPHPREAGRHLEEASRFVQPYEWYLHSAIGEQYALAGDFSRAIPHFRAALAGNPRLDDTAANLGAALLLSGQPAEALAHFDALLLRNPQNDRAHFFRGRALLALGRPAEALPSLQSAARLRPGKIEYESMLAVALSSAGKSPEAVARLRDLLRENPDSAEILNNLACLLADHPSSPVHDPAAAVSHALRAAELTGRKDPRILDTLASAYAAHGRFDEARQTAQQARDLAATAGDTNAAAQMETRMEDYRLRRPRRE